MKEDDSYKKAEDYLAAANNRKVLFAKNFWDTVELDERHFRRDSVMDYVKRYARMAVDSLYDMYQKFNDAFLDKSRKTRVYRIATLSLIEIELLERVLQPRISDDERMRLHGAIASVRWSRRYIEDEL